MPADAQHADMNFSRLALLVVAGCCVVLNPLRAQTPAPAPAPTLAPWTPDKQFKADQVITTKNGMTINCKVYVDTGKIRTESDAHGMTVVAIILIAEKKMYTVMDQEKMVMEIPLNDAKAREMQAATGGGDAKFEIMGPDAVDGVTYTKEKMTVGNDPKVYYWWIDRGANVPVKMASAERSFSVVFRNYQTGPQDASLFQPPAGYQVMKMPAGMHFPGGGGAGEQ
jgi:hypothetical protein